MSNQGTTSEEGNCLASSFGCMIMSGVFTAIIGKLFSLSNDSLQTIFVILTIIGVILAIFVPQTETANQPNRTIIEKEKNDIKIEIGADGELKSNFIDYKRFKKRYFLQGRGVSSSDPIYLIEGIYKLEYEFRDGDINSFTELRASIYLVGVDIEHQHEIISDISSKGSVTFRVSQSSRYIFQTQMKFFSSLKARTRVMADANKVWWNIDCKIIE